MEILYHLLVHIASVIFHTFVDLLKNWPFVFLLVILIFHKQIKELLAGFDILKLGKDGVELKKTAKEAKETLNDLQELATTMYVPVLDMLAKAGRWCGATPIEERLLNRDMILNFIAKHNITDNKILEKIEGINGSILFDVLHSMIDNLNGTSKVKIYSEIYKLFGSKPHNNFTCTPDMKTIKAKLEEYELFDNEVQYIFEEANNFIINKTFMNIEKLKKCMKQKSRYPEEDI